MYGSLFYVWCSQSLFWREIKKLNKIEIITIVNGTDNNKEILHLFKEKCQGNDRNMQQENNGL